MHCSQAEFSVLAVPQKEVKMGPRARQAVICNHGPQGSHHQQGRAEIQRGSWWGAGRFHQLEQKKKNFISNLYIQAINFPLASKESGKAPLPTSRYTAQHPFVTSCLEPFRIHLNTGILGFLFHEPGSLAIW